jgi:hypothetical protein
MSKRIFDSALAVVGLISLSPLLLLVHDLMHHFTVGNLQACFEAPEAPRRPELEDNRRTFHQKLRQMAYWPMLVRRVKLSEEDGTMRPLGISCTADKIRARAALLALGGDL